MAAKRKTGSSINWAALAERVPPAQRNNFVAFKARSDNYLRRALSFSESAPKIDWSYDKAQVPIAGLVDSFQKSYEALQIPYPADTVSSQIDAQESEVKAAIEAFVSESKKRIVEVKIEALIPYSEMTSEEFVEAHPGNAIDPKRPTFWPHFPEDQLGYKPKDAPDESHH